MMLFMVDMAKIQLMADMVMIFCMVWTAMILIFLIKISMEVQVTEEM